MFTLAKKFLNDDSGAAAAEYAILVALLAVGVVAALGAFTPALKTAFTQVGTTLTNDTN